MGLLDVVVNWCTGGGRGAAVGVGGPDGDEDQQGRRSCRCMTQDHSEVGAGAYVARQGCSGRARRVHYALIRIVLSYWSTADCRSSSADGRAHSGHQAPPS